MLVILIMSLQQYKLTSDRGFKSCDRLDVMFYFLKHFLTTSMDY